MGSNDVKCIDDIDTVFNILSIIMDSSLEFACDLYNGFCSGEIKRINRVDKHRISMFAGDNNSEYIFKFKRMLIYMPKISDEFSPILLFEAIQDEVDPKFKKYISVDPYNQHSLEGLVFPDEKRTEWDERAVSDFYDSMDNDEYFTVPKFHSIRHFLSSGVFCFINIKTLSYGQFDQFLGRKKINTLKDVEVLIRNAVKN